MRAACFGLILIFSAAFAWAQNPPAGTPPPPPAHHHGVGAMHDSHMQEMKSQVEQMRATLEKMKSNLAKLKDPTVKQQSQYDVDLWESMVKHMEGMVTMMSGDHQMGMMVGGMHDGGKHEGGMACCAKMESDEGGCCGGNKCMKPAAPSEKPVTPGN
jgi:hypothetical protein